MKAYFNERQVYCIFFIIPDMWIDVIITVRSDTEPNYNEAEYLSAPAAARDGSSLSSSVYNYNYPILLLV